MDEFVTVARLSDLPEQGGLEVMIAGRRIALFRHAGEVFATDALCPHRGGPLAAGWVENGHVFCPLHGWQFELDSGNCLSKESRPISVFQVQISEDQVGVRISQCEGL